MDLRSLILATFPALLSSSGCDTQSCTLADCGSGASITVETQDDASLPEGELEVVVEADGETRTATCTESDEEPSGGLFEGEDGAVQIRLTCGQTGLSVGLTAADPEDMPDDYRIQVFVDDELSLDESGTFEYSTSQPNGPDCGPTCRNASPVSLTLG
ncbi:MAG: hypothetical protein ACE37F_19180 [Nannocystaceae bacterium]|nr:hypothetical protein [bacterium]